MNRVLILGHRNPDTDSICSVIAYSELCNTIGPGGYIPARCGDINAETGYALSYFGVGPPRLVESVEPDVSDIPFKYPVSVPADLPTIEVVELMEKHGVRNIPVVDGRGHYLGLVGERGLARAYIRRMHIEPLSLSPIEPSTLARILDADIIVPCSQKLRGKVYIAIDALHVLLSRLTEHDIAIVGDNEPAQLALIQAGIAGLIITNGVPVGERVIKAAQEKGVAILSTELDAFGVGKLINLSLPARMIISTDAPVVREADSLEYVRELVTSSPYRTACVVTGDGRLTGMISRNTLLEDVKKSVILLDHNEPSQAVVGIERADILEIIDHHRLGPITTLKPIRFINRPVGSTCTIITELFQERGVTPSREAAGMLLSGILSDTLILRMSTTTEEDRSAVSYLAPIAGVDPVEYGTDLISAGMEGADRPLSERLVEDVKRYNLYGTDVIIAQVMVPSYDFATDHRDGIIEELRNLRNAHGADIYIALFTNIFEGSSDLFAAADAALLSKPGLQDQPLRLEGVMSRKKDFLPRIGTMIQRLG
ncbi:MAG: putative manganese-dependent inorganic diphosphatase [Methanoculleaceae archaeon]